MMGYIDGIWHNAAGEQVQPDVKLSLIGAHVRSGGKIFIGCDSNVVGTNCTYAIAVALYDDVTRTGGRYFFKRDRVTIPIRTPLRVRLMEEATRAIETALELQSVFPEARIEIHLDVSQRKENLSNAVADQVAGYAKAAGFDCKLKPESWASSCVADEHTR
jgi:predicted RNase H-related nuclease YkuK (DUF458 family)